MANPSFKGILNGTPKKRTQKQPEKKDTTKSKKKFDAIESPEKLKKKTDIKKNEVNKTFSKFSQKKEDKIPKTYTLGISHLTNLNKLAEQPIFKNYASVFRTIIDFADINSLVDSHNAGAQLTKEPTNITEALLNKKEAKKKEENKISRNFRMEPHQIDKISQLTKLGGFKSDSEAVRFILDSVDFEKLLG